MKKRVLLVLLIVCCMLLTGCLNKNTDDNDELINKKNEEKLLVCLENELESYIVYEKSILKDIPQDTFTTKNNKISYYKAKYTDDNNIYVIVKSDDYEVIRDFDLYFSNKYETYQTYYTGDNINVYVHNSANNVDLLDLEKCTVNSSLTEGKSMDSKIIEKLNKTSKIIVKSGDNKLGTLNEKNTIKEILSIISTSKRYGEAFLCDGYSFEFEMYDENEKLIDVIYVWGDGSRLIPKSIEGGCSYYSVSNKNIDIRKIIERETDYTFYSLYS